MAGRARWAAATILVLAAAVPLARLVVPADAAPPPRPPVAVRRAAAPILRATPTPAAAPARPAPAPLVVKRILDTGGPLRYGAFFWDDEGVPPGPLTITVDLKASVLSVFRGGYEIGTAAVIYGADDRATPLGVFPILQKDRHHFSSTYNHAPMPYTLRLTGDGVSIHASDVAADYATHGCIGLPLGFAKRLFAVAQVGDRVIVTKKGLSGDITRS